MKLIVTIPAHNEEQTIGQVIDEIPKKIKRIKRIQALVIDDGSSDRTAEIARKRGAVVLKNKSRLGLAFAFKKGLEKALEMGADIIVNTDADMQYNQKQIPDLIRPIIEGRADIVLGSRFRGTIEYMPLRKRLGNRLSTWVVRRVSGLPVSDAQTGFRAFSREAALRMNVQSDYTYTQETIIQAAAAKLEVKEIPIEFRKRAGESRLISSLPAYAKRVGATLIVGYLNYKPLRVFLGIGLLFFLAGIALGIRILVHFLATGLVSPFIPTAILTAILLIFGFQIIMIGLVAEMIKGEKTVQEEILYRVKKRASRH
jgi:glycosyltransferase involved in cell wall biosynthesis